MAEKRAIRKSIKLKGRYYYKAHLRIINSIIELAANKSMTETEMDVLSGFMFIPLPPYTTAMFNTNARKIVMEKLKLSPSSLSNYLKSLKRKGFLYEDDHKILHISPILKVDDSLQHYQFSLIKEQLQEHAVVNGSLKHE